jgi:CubicO group peptidase (beta-lactamase class C family)
MKRTNILTSIFAIVILASIASAQTGGGPGGITTTTITFNKQNFDNSLQNAIAPNVIGYQYVLIKDGQVVSEDAGGVAQNAADGTLMMTTSTPTNIGSLAKFLSGTAMIHLMEKKSGPGTWDDGLTLQQKLDRPFTSIVPDIWINGNRPGVEDITLRQLLQHRSGFNDNKPANRNVLGFLKDGDGFLLGQYDQRQYSNINFVLNGYLIALYENMWLKSFMNQSIANQGLGLVDADESVRQSAGSWMHNIMKTRIWDKMTPKILPNCDAANALANTAAYGYNSKDDLAAGQITSMISSQPWPITSLTSVRPT